MGRVGPTSIHAIRLCYQNRKEAVQSHNLPVSFNLIVVHYCPIATGIYYLIRLNMAGIQAIDNALLVSWSRVYTCDLKRLSPFRELITTREIIVLLYLDQPFIQK